jgi:hypothetical protein
MPLRAEFTPHLADPSPESWREICRLLDDPRITASQHMLDVHRLADELAAWPPEIERPPLKHWHDGAHAAELRLCLAVREVDLYRHYIDAAAGAPALRLRDGAPAARLERAFTGSLQGQGGRAHRVGVKGQGDLHGSLCVEWIDFGSYDARATGVPNACAVCQGCGKVAASRDDLSCAIHGTEWRRLSVSLEVEVKRDGGRIRPEQEARATALRRRGELYLLVNRTAEMIRLLVAERARILSTITRR